MNIFPFLLSLGAVFAIIHLLSSKPRKNWHETFKIVLLYQLIFSVGIYSLFAFYAHTYMADQVAEYIGWPPGNPFQQEVAYTSLSFGILGLLCYWFRGLFWVATIIGFSIWYWANAYGHIYQWMVNQNTNPGNIGMPLYVDVFLPMLLISLLVGYLATTPGINQGN